MAKITSNILLELLVASPSASCPPQYDASFFRTQIYHSFPQFNIGEVSRKYITVPL